MSRKDVAIPSQCRFAKALAELQIAAGEHSPRAYAYRYMADSKRAVLGVLVSPGPTVAGVVRGATITAVTPGSGAEAAGLRHGDLLLKAGDVDLSTPAGSRPDPTLLLRDAISGLEDNAEIALQYERDGKLKKVVAKAHRAKGMALAQHWSWVDDGERELLMPTPPMPPELPAPPAPGMYGRGLRHGAYTDIDDLQLAKMDKNLAAYFKTDTGVLVVQAPEGGKLGLHSGDVILALNGDAVTTPVSVLERLGDDDAGSKVRFDIVRKGMKKSVEGELPAADQRHDVRHEIIIRHHDAAPQAD